MRPRKKAPAINSFWAFEQVWKTIDSKHWESNSNGLEWQRIREEFEPRITTATEAAQVDQILNEMLGRLKQSHFGVIPASQYELVWFGFVRLGLARPDTALVFYIAMKLLPPCMLWPRLRRGQST